MKKFLSIALLGIVILFSLSSCDRENSKDITIEYAKQVVLEDYNITQENVEFISESVDDNGIYTIIFKDIKEDKTIKYNIGQKGEIISSDSTILTTIKSFFYGIVEGITEWLPISSTGHLILFEEFFGFNVGSKFLELFRVVIQLGAIMAVVILFWKKIWPFHSKKTLNNINWKNPVNNGFFGGVQKFCNNYVYLDKIVLWLKILVACLPAAVLGLMLDDWLDANLYNFQTVALTLLIYGIGFIIVENMRNQNRIKANTKTLTDLSFKTALIIGMFQVLSMIPGTSRSGATILGAILIGCSREVAAEFSFFLAIPVMFGASLLKSVKLIGSIVFTPQIIICLITGILVAFIVSVIAIKFLMSYIKKHDFKAFGYYRIILSAILFIYIIFNAVFA